MRESKLTELICGLSRNELKKFGEFLNSPYHNKSKNIIRLYDFIADNIEEFETNTLTREWVAHSVFPDETYNDQNVRTLTSTFTRLIEKFIVYESIENDFYTYKINLLKSLSSRNLDKSFEMTSNELAEEFKKDFNKDSDYYHYLLTLIERGIYHKGQDLDINLDGDFYKLSDTADSYFMINKLKIINSFISRKSHAFGNVKMKFWQIDSIFEKIEQDLEKLKTEHPTIYSEYLILMMMLKPKEEKYFTSLLAYVLKNMKRYTPYELEEVYFSLTNYCINKISEGKVKFASSLFKIYKKFERFGLYEKMSFIQYTDFLSVVISGVHLGKMKWVEYFFEKYRAHVSKQFRRDTVSLAEAVIHFKYKKFDAAMTCLNRVQKRNSYLYIKSKETLIKIYYEKKEMNLISSQIDSMRHYLKRHQDKLSLHYERYINFLNLLNQLLKLNPKDKAGIHQMKKTLTKNINAIGRDWLLEKIEERI